MEVTDIYHVRDRSTFLILRDGAKDLTVQMGRLRVGGSIGDAEQRQGYGNAAQRKECAMVAVSGEGLRLNGPYLAIAPF